MFGVENNYNYSNIKSFFFLSVYRAKNSLMLSHFEKCGLEIRWSVGSRRVHHFVGWTTAATMNI